MSFSLDIFLRYDGSFANRCHRIKRKRRDISQGNPAITMGSIATTPA
jgi:hypothetical protein